MKKIATLALLVLTACSGTQKNADRHLRADSAKTEVTNAPITAGANQPDTTALSAPDNFVIIPGKQVGAITAVSTEDQLRQQLGDEIVRRDTLWDAEGEYTMGTSLFAGTPNQVLIAWKDTVRHARPDYVIVRPSNKNSGSAGSRTQWIIPGGPTIGSTLKEVEKMNGRPFRLYGFGWDYGGTVADFNGGKLGPKGHPGTLSLQFRNDSESERIQKLEEQVLGDAPFLSTLPALQEMNPTVFELVIGFPK